ncbi:MAG: transcriptional regulator [Pseudomonadota bacterium]
MHFKKTQKEISGLLGISLRSVQSFEQGWRRIPTNIERQIFYLVFMKHTKGKTLTPCWKLENCPPDKRKHCPAWEFHTGHLCWFINGTICQGKVHRDWDEKMKFCRKCKVLEPMNSLLSELSATFVPEKMSAGIGKGKGKEMVKKENNITISLG